MCFFAGGNVFTCQKTIYPLVFRALSVQTAHGYAVNRHYIDKLLACLKESYQELLSYPFIVHTPEEAAFDQKWKELQKKDRWYFVILFCQQRKSFSDISWAMRDRKHREDFVG